MITKHLMCIKNICFQENPRSCAYLKKFPLKNKYILSSHWFTSYSFGQIIKKKHYSLSPFTNVTQELTLFAAMQQKNAKQKC